VLRLGAGADGAEKAVEALFTAGLGLFLAFYRYPSDVEGDRVNVWAARLLRYLRRDRRGSLFSGG
jgi:hypothetical protein